MIFRILVLLGLIVFAWRAINRSAFLTRQFQSSLRSKSRMDNASTVNSAMPIAEDLVKCPVCASYVMMRMTNDCGRVACPYGRAI